MSGPSQPKVVDEDWSDERVKSFLSVLPQDAINEDYWMLLKAYQAMVPFDFERFVAFFVAEGRNLNAQGPEGESLPQRLARHRKAVAYAEIIEKAQG